MAPTQRSDPRGAGAPAVRASVLALAVGLGLAGCGSGADAESTTTTSADEPASSPSSTSEATILEDGAAVPLSDAEAFLACVKERESGGDYTAVGPGAVAFGAYQMTQDAWDETAEHAGYTNLVGIQPNYATAADQDKMAMALLEWKGQEPWTGSCTWPPGTGPGSGGPGDTSG